MILKLKTQFAPLINLEPRYQRPLRVVIALAYTALLTLVLIQSSAHPVVGPVAPRDYNLAWEMFLTTGHLVGFSLLVFLIWSALATVTSSTRSLIIAVIFACLLGLITEILQPLCLTAVPRFLIWLVIGAWLSPWPISFIARPK